MNESGKLDEPSFKLDINGFSFASDEMPYMVLGKQVESGASVRDLLQIISDEIKSHNNLCHTTTLDKFKLIVSNMTLRCNNLTSADLNDAMERQRVNVSQYANGRFISCFSHISHESVPFWSLYGTEKQTKLFLIFNNFSSFLAGAIHLDYCLLDGGAKAFFRSDEYTRTANTNSPMFGQNLGLSKNNEAFDTRNCIESIEMFDIEYLPVNHEAFTADYSSEARIHFGDGPDAPYLTMRQDRPECLGKQKSDPWDYEKESRILCCLHIQDFKEWTCVYLRLKAEIFRGLNIILSPWAEASLRDEVFEVIKNSELTDEIKDSIEIKSSGLEGTLNF